MFFVQPYIKECYYGDRVAKKALGLKSKSTTPHREESLPPSGFTVANLSTRTLPGGHTHTRTHLHRAVPGSVY